MKNTNRFIFTMYCIGSILLIVVLGIKQYHNISSCPILTIVYVCITAIYGFLWVYNTEDVPEGGFWITLSGNYFTVGDLLSIGNDENFLGIIYKAKGNNYYLMPTKNSILH